ncbi:hypothetical protein ACFV1N_45975 [Streptosporangium canum]|uniref:hypothetical protein n=1 Tax=Streptosporangium canum TaxID=324952 RepID=UPI0036CFEB2F
MRIYGITFSLNVSLIFNGDYITAEDAEAAFCQLVEKLGPDGRQLIAIGCGDSFDHTPFTPTGSYPYEAEAASEAAQLDFLLQIADLLSTDSEQLDELVHDLVSQHGSSINNGGLPAQLAYLINAIGADSVRELLRQEAADRAFVAA